jgi:hypothetical protein
MALLLLALMVMPSIAAAPGETVDLQMITQIRQEGFRNSQVMKFLSEITDQFGGRVTGSPSMKAANEWTMHELEKMGLVNAHLEAYPFGRGWEMEGSEVRMVSPDFAVLTALPQAWTPGTNGVVRGKVVKFTVNSVEDLEKYRGKLAGAILLSGEMPSLPLPTDPVARRYDDKNLDEIADYPVGPRGGPRPPQMDPAERRRRMQLQQAVTKFLADEKILAMIQPSRGDGGLVFVGSAGPYQKDRPATPYPVLAMSVEHYGRIDRLLQLNIPVELELNIQSKFYDDDPNAYNTVAEIPGTDLKDQVVMLGGHLDSWHGATGATDDAAGVAACMEAVRILKALGVKPRRTIRVAFWSGEEQGLLGSRAYASQHLAERPQPPRQPGQDPAMQFMRPPQGPLNIKPEWDKVSAYFNIDNGGGRLRGIYLQGNAAVRPMFEAWVEPFRDLGFTTITMRDTGGTDHQSFDGVGVPGFQFIQDPMDYGTRTHHSNEDAYERIQPGDMMQMSVILASFVYNAAMREQMLPRKPLAESDRPAVKAPEPAPLAPPAKGKAAKPAKKPPAKPSGN